MTHCELHELQISAMLDGEADLHEQQAVLEHVLVCENCRQFYGSARGLQGLVDGMPLTEDRQTATESLPRRRFLPAGGLPAWAQVAAILLFLVLGLAIGRGVGTGVSPDRAPEEFAAPGGERTIDLRLASEAGAMTDARFTALTLDLLRADTRYQQKMSEILRILAPAGPASTEGGFDRAMELEGAEPGGSGEQESVNGPAIDGRRSIY